MPDETHPAAKALTSFAAKMRDMADAMEKADRMIYERLILGIPAEPEVLTVVRLGGKHPDFIRDGYNNEHPWATLGGNGFERRTWAEVCRLGTPEVLEPESVKALRKSYEREHRLSLGFAERASKAEDKAKEWEGKYDAMEVERDEARATVETRDLQMQDMHRTLDSVQKRAKEWADADYEPANDASAATLNTTNRHGREILHLLDATPAVSASFSDFAGNPIPATITVTRSGAEDEPAEPAPVEVTEEPADLSLAVRGSGGTVWEQRRSRHMPDLFFWYDGQRAHDAGDGRSWSYLLAHHGPLTLVETGAKS